MGLNIGKNDLQKPGSRELRLRHAPHQGLPSHASTHTAFAVSCLPSWPLQMTLQVNSSLNGQRLSAVVNRWAPLGASFPSCCLLIQHVYLPLHCAPPEGCVCLSLCDLCGATLKQWLTKCLCVFPVYPSGAPWFHLNSTTGLDGIRCSWFHTGSVSRKVSLNTATTEAPLSLSSPGWRWLPTHCKVISYWPLGKVSERNTPAKPLTAQWAFRFCHSSAFTFLNSSLAKTLWLTYT